MTTEKGAGKLRSVTSDSTRGRVEHTTVFTERVGDITTVARPVSNGDPPIIGVWIPALDILGNLVTRKPPERDLSVIPAHNENTAASRVEWTTSASLEITNSTTSVVTI